jgi:predicted Zn-ribbon and HTH transcriptional regulator
MAALELARECIAATAAHFQAEGRAGPGAHFYTERAAAILHRMKDYAGEVTVLRAYLDPSPYVHADLVQKLHRAEAELDAQQNIDAPPVCPACGVVFDRWPSRNRSACPECRVALVTRTVIGRRLLITETDDANRSAKAAYEKQRARILRQVGSLGISQETFDTLEKAEPKGGLAGAYWAAVVAGRERAVKNGDWWREYTSLTMLATIRAHENRPWVDLARQADDIYIDKVLTLQNLDQELFLYGCGCDSCEVKQQGMTVREYLEIRPTPHLDCKSAPCFCTLRVIGERENAISHRR